MTRLPNSQEPATVPPTTTPPTNLLREVSSTEETRVRKDYEQRLRKRKGEKWWAENKHRLDDMWEDARELLL